MLACRAAPARPFALCLPGRAHRPQGWGASSAATCLGALALFEVPGTGAPPATGAAVTVGPAMKHSHARSARGPARASQSVGAAVRLLAARRPRRATPTCCRRCRSAGSASLLVCAQLPHALNVPAWVALFGVAAGRRAHACSARATPPRAGAAPARIRSWALVVLAVITARARPRCPTATWPGATPGRVPVRAGGHQVPRGAHAARRHAAALPRRGS
ncbi:MAG: hypothetical protein MZW92_70540 [Comamonadaceae bacterium]|nr:hypothetical protein [Comamonadaceae bacterium]